MNQPLRNDLFGIAKELNVPVEQGLTFCADDFYEGQMRMDGYFCEYTMQDKFDFLNKLRQLGMYFLKVYVLKRHKKV